MTEYIDEDALKYVMALPQGRTVLRQILSIGGFARQPFAPGDSDLTAFNCGNLNTGIIVFAECMSASPELTAIMLKETPNDNRDTAKRDDKPVLRRSVNSLDGTVAGNDERSSGNDDSGLGFDRLGFGRSTED